ncbi:MAG: DUF2807 domain-containing protein [Bacteroidales bacterium]|nr:DUF2807 domain-containing protein [Bacteroidales bacterium]
MKNLKISIVAILLVSLIFTSCTKSIFYISGQGDIVEQTLTLDEFTQISNNGSFDVYVTQGDVQEVVAVGHQNIIDRLKTNVFGSKWNIELLPGRYKNYDLTIYITVTNLSDVKINGSGNIQVEGMYNVNEFDLHINGSGSISVLNSINCNNANIQIAGSRNITVLDTINTENLDVEIAGSGSIELKTAASKIDANIIGSGDILIGGSTIIQYLRINGSGSYSGFNVLSEDVEITVSGSGDTEITVTDNLDVKILGSGDVYYMGTPNINLNISGSGSVINRN